MEKIMTPYVEIFDPTGRLMETMHEGCERYARSTELKMLEMGYTIKVHGRKLTKKELKEDAE
jgi:hypothetical protein